MALSIAANVMDLLKRTPLGDTQNGEGDIRPLPVYLVGAGESTDFPDLLSRFQGNVANGQVQHLSCPDEALN